MWRWIRWVAIILILAVFLYSGYRVLDYLLETKESEDAVSSYRDLAVRPAPTEATELTEATEEEKPGFTLSTEPVDRGEMAPIAVDFRLLQNESDDIIAWLYSPDTPINYPVLQGENNDTYLHHLPNGKYNFAGSLFVDSACADDFSSPCTVIHGHNMKNDTMFGSLPDYESQEYFEKHSKLYLITPEHSYRVDLIAGFVTPWDGYIYEWEEYCSNLRVSIPFFKEQSDFVSDVTAEPGDRLLLLSTCTYDFYEARYVVLGKMTEILSAPLPET